MWPQKGFTSVLFVAFFVVLLQGVVYALRMLWSDIGVCNTEGAWGIAMSFPLLTAVSLTTILFFGAIWFFERNHLLHWLWGIIMVAGISNLLERLLYGCVFDYLKLPYFPYFNIADLLLTGCIVVYVFVSIFSKNK